MVDNNIDFPNEAKSFIDHHSFKDDQEIYTNGSYLIPVYRVQQMLEHYYGVGNTRKMIAEPTIKVRPFNGRPYYEIRYYDIELKEWHVGYSSYFLRAVMENLCTCFEIVPLPKEVQSEPLHVCSSCIHKYLNPTEEPCCNCNHVMSDMYEEDRSDGIARIIRNAASSCSDALKEKVNAEVKCRKGTVELINGLTPEELE